MVKDIRNIKKGWDRARYFATNFGLYFLPDYFSGLCFNTSRKGLSDEEQEEITRRTKYYARLNPCRLENSDSLISVKDFRYPFNQKTKHSTYFFDFYPFIRRFSDELKFHYIAGDIDYEPEKPTFVKARPVTDSHSNSVILRLNSIRHFRFVNDIVPYEKKDNVIVSRNEVRQQPWRSLLLEKYIGHEMTDFGQINSDASRPEWVKPYLSISEQLKHKFVMCLQGHDVATNLKWVMSSNSVAVMPRPTIESWYMEAQLKPDYHYIEIKSDYSDLMEKVEWFITHPSDSKEIIHNAQQWVSRFKNIRVERIIMEEVVKRYFKLTGQL